MAEFNAVDLLGGAQSPKDILRGLAVMHKYGMHMRVDKLRKLVASIGPDHISNILTTNITANLSEAYWSWGTDWKDWIDIGRSDYLDTQVVERIPRLDMVPMLKTQGDTFQELTIRNATEISYEIEGAGGIQSVDLRTKRSDRLDYFDKLGARLGDSMGSRLHEWMYITMLRDNPTHDDGNSLFDSTNNGNDNDSGSAGVALTSNELRAVFRLADVMVDEASQPLHSDFYSLVCGWYNWEPAMQIFEDQDKPGTANRDKNIIRSRVKKVIFSKKLNYDWYLIADPKQVPGLHVDFFEGRDEPLVEQEKADSSFQFENPGHQRWSVSLMWGGDWVNPEAALRGSTNNEPS